MNVQEFRVGNYIKDTFDIKNIEIRKLDLEDFSVMLNFQNSNNHSIPYNPILLTEELLLKCGFKKSRNIGCYDTDKDAFFFESDKINLTIDFIPSSSNHYYQSNPVDGAIPLKYLHQLQNIVFSVTGQELEINL